MVDTTSPVWHAGASTTQRDPTLPFSRAVSSLPRLYPLPEHLPYLWRRSTVALKKPGLSRFQRALCPQG